MSDTQNVEVKTKLTVDTAGGEQMLNGLRRGFEELHRSRETAQQGLGFFRQTLAMTAGMEIQEGIHKAKEFAESFIEIAEANETYVRANAALVVGMQGIPWANATEQAEYMNSALGALATEAAKSGSEIKGAFQVMTEISGASEESMEHNIASLRQMANISRVLGVNTESVAREYQMMDEGMLRTRGQLFQLLYSTGIFGDKIKGAAGNWAKLTEEERSKRLAEGMAQLGTSMAAAPLSIADRMQQMRNMINGAKRDLGQPLLEAIAPQIERLVHWTRANRASLKEYTEGLAEHASKYAEQAAQLIKSGWEYISQHSEEIKHGIIEAWTLAKTVIDFAIQHKEALAIAYVGHKVVGSELGKGALEIGKGVYEAGAAGGIARGAGGAVMGAGALGGAAALGAFAAAIGGVALAATQATKLMKEVAVANSDEEARYEAVRRMAEEGKHDFEEWSESGQRTFEVLRQNFVAHAAEVNLSRGEADRKMEAILEEHEANLKLVASAREAAAALNEATESQSTRDGKFQYQDAMVGEIVAGFQNAMAANNVGAEEFIASLLTKSKDVQDAFLASAQMTSQGYQILADMTAESADEFSRQLRDRALATAEHKKAYAAAPKVQFNGGQTFKIQQDFRDQDPDRVADIFQKDILAAAERRYQASTASPFGT